MRAFHLAWSAFFVCFFGWFGIAPLMAVVREDLQLTSTQIADTIIASVAITIVARLAIGWLCDRHGPRKTYAWLLILGAAPVMSIGLADSYATFLLCRLAIGVVGASFVITQYHVSLMFAPSCVGTANATSAGWGNMGGGITQMAMPAIAAGIVALGADRFLAWRLAMVVPGVVMLGFGVAYLRLTRDTPQGNFDELRASGALPPRTAGGGFRAAVRDPRVWALFVIYAACFGIELTINNVAALHFRDEFGLGLGTAGLIAGAFGAMNLFARSLGGLAGDRAGLRWGLQGRVTLLGAVLLLEGMALVVFSQMTTLPAAIAALIVFSLFVQMTEGATFAVVPFVNRDALGAVSGIVGAGGNVGAVAAGFLLRTEGMSIRTALFYLGLIAASSSAAVLVIRFSEREERDVGVELGATAVAR